MAILGHPPKKEVTRSFFGALFTFVFDFDFKVALEGLEAAIERKKREKPPREIKFGGDFEARLIALACSEPPDGRARWTIRLLAEKVVELEIAPSVSPMTVCNTLKKTNFSLT